MVKAASYARYSDESQREESIEAQEKAIQEYADKNGYVIVQKYADHHITGRRDDRPQLQKLLKDAAAGLFDTVLIHKIDRFGRNKIQIALNRYALQQLGIKLIPVAEYFGDGPHAVIMESVMEGLAEFYSLNLAQETMKGLLINADKCRYNGGRVLYGYKVNEEQKYELNLEEAEIVKEIFERVADGWAYGAIIRDLNVRGIKRRGRLWGKNSIHEMLKNERYTGVYLFNRVPKTVNNKRNSRIKKPDDEIIRIEGGMPQIVERELFLRVQEIMEKRKHEPHSRVKKRLYLLTGLVECGECGAAYIGDSASRSKKEYLYYRCSGGQRRGGCSNKRVQKNELEQIVIDRIVGMIREIDPVAFAEEYNAYLLEQAATKSEAVVELEAELKDLKKKVDNLLDVVEDGGAVVRARLRKYSARISEIESAIERAERAARANRVTPEQVKAIINRLDPLGAKSDNELKEKIRGVISKIIIYPGKTEIISSLEMGKYV